MKTLNERSIKNLNEVHPDLIRVMQEAIKDTPIEFTITEGVRTTARQRQLYAQGRTEPGKILTSADGITLFSNHQKKTDGYGHAVDLYANPINVNDTKNIKIVADHILDTAKRLGVKMEWGGNWKMRDYPHFELKR